MDLNSERLESIKRILEANDMARLKKIETFFDENENESWEELDSEPQEEIL